MSKIYLLILCAIFTAQISFSQTADFSANNTVICAGESVQFTDLSTGATSYSWTFPDGGAGQTSTLPNPVIVYNVPGSYTVTLVVSNGVSNDTEIKTNYITVLATATATLNTAGMDTQSVCIGAFINQMIYVVNGAAGVTFTGLPAGIVGLYTPSPTGGGIVAIAGPPSPPGIYPWSFTTNGTTCNPVTVNGLITVGAINGLTLNSGQANQQICLGTPMTSIVLDVAGNPDSVVVTGLPPGITGTLAGGQFTISGTATGSGSFVYTVTAAGNPCSQAQFSGGLDVGPILNLASPPGSNTPTLCVNNPLPNIFYTLGSDITGATVTGLPPGVTGTFNPGSFLITNTPSAVGVFNYTITTSGGPCGPVTATGTITVDTLPVLTHSNPGTEIQNVCEGTPISVLFYTFGGGATGATATGLPAGLTAAAVGNNFTISGTPTQSGTFNFMVSTTGSSCGQIDSLGTFIIDGIPDLQLNSGPQTDSQTVCINTPMADLIYVLSGTATSIQVSGLPAGITSNVVGSTITISGSPTAVGTFPFMIYTQGGLCAPDTVFCQITTDNPPLLTLASAASTSNQTLCDNSSIVPIIYVISGAATSASASGLPAGVTQSFSNDTLTISGNPTGIGTWNYTVIASGGLCPNATMTGTIAAYEPEINLVSPISTITQQLCVNTTIDPIVYVFSGGATGATALNLPPGVIATIQNDTMIISGTPTVPGTNPFIVHTNGTPCQADSSYGLFTVEIAPVIVLISAVGTDNQTVDENDAITQIVYFVTGNASNYTVSGLPTGISSSTLGDSIIISGSSAAIGLWPYVVSATGVVCPVSPVNGTITILEDQDTLPPPPPPVDSTEIFVPNLFSPNDDDKNDKWVILQLDQFTNVEVAIINREGQVVFEDKDYKNTWDGTYNGDKLPEATYYYRLNFDDGDVILKGAVTILRNEK